MRSFDTRTTEEDRPHAPAFGRAARAEEEELQPGLQPPPAVADIVSRAQDTFGNGLVAGALRGDAFSGLGQAVAGELALAMAGITLADGGMRSNAAMIRFLARCDDRGLSELGDEGFVGVTGEQGGSDTLLGIAAELGFVDAPTTDGAALGGGVLGGGVLGGATLDGAALGGAALGGAALVDATLGAGTDTGAGSISAGVEGAYAAASGVPRRRRHKDENDDIMHFILASHGAPIPAAVAARMSAALGEDVSDARVHVDAAADTAADALNAVAFAIGEDVYFSSGAYAPGTRAGDEVLAHELTHVVQAREGRLPKPSGKGLAVSSPSDAPEQEAVSSARAAVKALAAGAGEAEEPAAAGSQRAAGGGAGAGGAAGARTDGAAGADRSEATGAGTDGTGHAAAGAGGGADAAGGGAVGGAVDGGADAKDTAGAAGAGSGAAKRSRGGRAKGAAASAGAGGPSGAAGAEAGAGAVAGESAATAGATGGGATRGGAARGGGAGERAGRGPLGGGRRVASQGGPSAAGGSTDGQHAGVGAEGGAAGMGSSGSGVSGPVGAGGTAEVAGTAGAAGVGAAGVGAAGVGAAGAAGATSSRARGARAAAAVQSPAPTAAPGIAGPETTPAPGPAPGAETATSPTRGRGGRGRSGASNTVGNSLGVSIPTAVNIDPASLSDPTSARDAANSAALGSGASDTRGVSEPASLSDPTSARDAANSAALGSGADLQGEAPAASTSPAGPDAGPILRIANGPAPGAAAPGAAGPATSGPGAAGPAADASDALFHVGDTVWITVDGDRRPGVVVSVKEPEADPNAATDPSAGGPNAATDPARSAGGPNAAPSKPAGPPAAPGSAAPGADKPGPKVPAGPSKDPAKDPADPAADRAANDKHDYAVLPVGAAGEPLTLKAKDLLALPAGELPPSKKMEPGARIWVGAKGGAPRQGFLLSMVGDRQTVLFLDGTQEEHPKAELSLGKSPDAAQPAHEPGDAVAVTLPDGKAAEAKVSAATPTRPPDAPAPDTAGRSEAFRYRVQLTGPFSYRGLASMTFGARHLAERRGRLPAPAGGPGANTSGANAPGAHATSHEQADAAPTHAATAGTLSPTATPAPSHAPGAPGGATPTAAARPAVSIGPRHAPTAAARRPTAARGATSPMALARAVRAATKVAVDHPGAGGVAGGHPPPQDKRTLAERADAAGKAAMLALAQPAAPGKPGAAALIDPTSGKPLAVDPKTGQPLAIDPKTGKPAAIDPKTGKPVAVDAKTGQPIDPANGAAIPPGQAVDPKTGKPVPGAMAVIDPKTGLPVVDATTGAPVAGPDTAALEAKQKQLQEEMAAIEAELGRGGDALARNEAAAVRATAELEDNQARLARRRQKLERDAAIAQKYGRKVAPPDKDGQVRRHLLKNEDIEEQRAKLGKERDDLGKAAEALREKQAEKEKELQAVQAELQEAAAKARAASGGGASAGGGAPAGPPREVDVAATSKNLLAALQGKKGPEEKKKKDADKAVADLEKKIATAQGLLDAAKTRLGTLKGELETANTALSSATTRLSQRKSQLAADAKATTDGKAAPSPSSDATCKQLTGEISGLRSKVSKLQSEKKRMEDQEKTATSDIKDAKAELEKAKKKAEEANKKFTELETALTELAAPTGAAHYQMIADNFKVPVKVVHLPPGMTLDDDGKPVKIEEKKKQDEEKLAKAEELEKLQDADAQKEAKDKAKDDADKAAADKKAEADAEAKLTDEEKKAKAAKAAEDKEDSVVTAVSAMKDMGPEERKAEMERLQKLHKKSAAELQAAYDKTVAAAAEKLKDQKGTITKEMAEKAGVSKADLDVMLADRRRKELEAKAAKIFGVPGPEAVDKLHAAGKDRGLKPAQMLAHLAHAPAESLPPELKDAAKKAASEEASRVAALPEAERKAAEEAAVKAKADAEKTEKKLTNNKEVAAALGCDPKDAEAYIQSLKDKTGVDDQTAADILKKKGTAAAGTKTLSKDELSKKMAEIHALPEKERAAALQKLAADTGDPQVLLGATLTVETDASGVLKGPVASEALNKQLAAIDKLPKDQQWAAMVKLGQVSGVSPNELAKARKNYDKKNDAVVSVAKISTDPLLTQKQKDEKIAALAERYKTDPEKLKKLYGDALAKTEEDLKVAAKNPTVAEKLKTLETLKPEEKQKFLEQLAADTGIPAAALMRMESAKDFKKAKEKWGKQLGKDPDAAADLLAVQAKQRGLTPDQLIQHIRDCPKDKLPPELAALKPNIEAADRKDPANKEREELKEKAGLGADEKFEKLETDPAKIAELETKDPAAYAKAKQEYDAYCKKRDALLDELNSTNVNDEDSLKLLMAMSPKERAALLAQTPPVVDEEGDPILTSFAAGVDMDDTEGKAAKVLFDQAEAYKTGAEKYAGKDNAAAEQAAIALEARVGAEKQAATAFGMEDSVEAGAHLKALAGKYGKSPEEVLRFLQTQGKDPQEALKEVYAEAAGQGAETNLAVKSQLARIQALPQEERDAAMERFMDLSGLTPAQVHAQQKAIAREEDLVAKVHSLAQLPADKKKKAMEELAASQKPAKSVAELEQLYTTSLAEVEKRLPPTAVLVAANSSFESGDIQKQVDELARQTGLPKADILRLVEARRGQQLEKDSAKLFSGSGMSIEDVRTRAYERDMSPEEFVDFIARSPASALDPDLQKLKQSLDANGYVAKLSSAERAEAIKNGFIADPESAEYKRKKGELWNQLTTTHDDDKLLAAFRSMTPAERKLFVDQWEAERERARKDGKDVPEDIESAFKSALQLGDETEGVALLKEAKAFDSKQAIKSLMGVDPKDPKYVAKREALTTELKKGEDADEDDVKELLKGMTPAERAQFLKEYAELRTNLDAEVKTGNAEKDQAKLPPDLRALLEGDEEAQGWLKDANLLGGSKIATEAQKKAEKVEESVRIGKEAAALLSKDGPPMDARDAYRAVEKMGKDRGMSPANVLRFLKGEPLVDDTDTRSEYVKRHTKAIKAACNPDRADPAASTATVGEDGKPLPPRVGGHTLNDEKVEEKRKVLEQVAAGDIEKTPKELAELVAGCNPRELAELNEKMNGRLKPILEQATEEGSPERAEIAGSLRKMDGFKADQKHYELVAEAKANDPDANADTSTPEGFAKKLAWCKNLPPDMRLRELEKLRSSGQTPDGQPMSARDVMAAYLNGPQGVTDGKDSTVLTPAVMEQLASYEKLPPHERDAAVAALAHLVGRSPKDLQDAEKRSTKELGVATKLQEIKQLPADEQQAKILELSEQNNLSINDLEDLHARAVESGLLVVGPRPVAPDVAKRIEAIERIEDPAKRKAALAALQTETGLSTDDLVSHVEGVIERDRKARGEMEKVHQGSNAMGDKLREGDEDKIKKHIKGFAGRPEELKKILEVYGYDKLRGELLDEFGDDNDFKDLMVIVDQAKAFEQAPELPSSIDPKWSRELVRINRLPAAERDAQLDALKAKFSAADFDALSRHAAHGQKVFEAQLAAKVKLLTAETDSTYIEDARVKEVLADADPTLLAELQRTQPALMKDVLGGLDDNAKADLQARLTAAAEMVNLPMADRAAAEQKSRVAHKAAELKKEFDATFYSDDARIKELLRDCTPEELKELDKQFDGKLQAKIDEATGPSWLGTLAMGAALIVTGPMLGPLLLIGAGIGMLGSQNSATGDAELLGIKARLRDAKVDPKTGFPVDTKKVADSLEIIRRELDASVWTNDAAVIGAMKDLNPKELAEVKQKYEAEHGAGSFEQKLRAGLSGDDLALAIGQLRQGDDDLSRIDRGKLMKDQCRQLAIQDRLRELRRDPAHKGKPDGDLYAIIANENDTIEQKTKDRVKKIRDSADALYKAIDGWGDDVDAMNNALVGLTPDEAELVKVEYRRHYGKDLDIQMTEDLGWWDNHEAATAKKLMSKEGRLDGLREVLLSKSEKSWTEDEDFLYRTLEGLTPEERTKLVTGPGGPDLLRRIKADLGENERRMIDALTEVDPKTGLAEPNPAHVAAVRMKMNIHGSGDWWDFSAAGTKEEELVTELDKLSPEQVREAMSYYDAHLADGGNTFVGDLRSDFGTTGSDARAWEIIDAELRGDKVGADVHRLKWAAQNENDSGYGILVAAMMFNPVGWVGLAVLAGMKAANVKIPAVESTDEDLLEKTLTAGKEGRGGRDAAHLKKVMDRFNTTFGQKGGEYEVTEGTGQSPFQKMLGQETEGVERAYFEQLGERGEADDELTLLYAMDGAGTNEEKAKKVLEKMYGMTPSQRAAFTAKFNALASQMTGSAEPLEEWIEDDFGGAEKFELKLLLRGKPTTPQDYLEIARMRYEFERGGVGNAIGNVFMDGLEALGAHSASSQLARDTAAIETLFDEKGQLKGGQASMERLEELAAWQEADAKAYAAVRDTVADTASNVIMVVGGVVLAVVPGTQGLSAAIWTAFFLALAAAGTKAALKGSHYSAEEAGMDLAQAAVAALTAGLGNALQAAKGVTQTFIQKLLKKALEGAVESLLNAGLSSEQAFAAGDFAAFQHILKETVLGTIKKMAMHVVGEGLGATKWGKRLADIESGNPMAKSGFAEHLALKYADNVLKAAAGQVLDAKQWEQWANAKGVDKKLFKTLFVDTAADALGNVALSRTKVIQQMKLDHTKKELEKYAGEVADLHAKLAAADDPKVRAQLAAALEVKRAGLAETQKELDGLEQDHAALLQEEARLREKADAEAAARRAAKAELDAKIAGKTALPDGVSDEDIERIHQTTAGVQKVADAKADAADAKHTAAKDALDDDERMATIADMAALVAAEKAAAKKREDADGDAVDAGADAKVDAKADAKVEAKADAKEGGNEDGAEQAAKAAAKLAPGDEESAALDAADGKVAARVEEKADTEDQGADQAIALLGQGGQSPPRNAPPVIDEDSSGPVSKPVVDGDEADGTRFVTLQDIVAAGKAARASDTGLDGDEADGTRIATVKDMADLVAAGNTAAAKQAVNAELESLAKQGGTGAIVQRIAAIEDPHEQVRVLALIAAYGALMTKNPREMTPAERDVVLLAHVELDAGMLGATTMRKVIPVDQVMDVIDGTRSLHVGGSVGDARNTAGLKPEEVISVLGLDYADGKGLTPYLKDDGSGGFRPIDELFFMDMPITPQMREKAQIPLDTALAEHAEASTDPRIRALADNDRILTGDWQDVRLNPDSTRDTSNPYTGTGGTAPSNRLPGGPVRTNQELQIPTDRKAGNHGADLPVGTEMKIRRPDGSDQVVARLEPTAGGAKWVINPALPADVAAKIAKNIVPAVVAATPGAHATPAPVAHGAGATPAAVTPAAVTPASVTPAAVTPAAVTPAVATPAAVAAVSTPAAVAAVSAPAAHPGVAPPAPAAHAPPVTHADVSADVSPSLATPVAATPVTHADVSADVSPVAAHVAPTAAPVTHADVSADVSPGVSPALASSPAARRTFDDDLASLARLGGTDALVDRVKQIPDPAEQERVLALFVDYGKIIAKNPREMSDAEKDLVLTAHAELDVGFLSAATMRKVIPADAIPNMLDGSWSPHVSGSVGDARNTEGLLPTQIVSVLGLDYADGRGRTPYLTGDDATGFTPIDELFFVDMPISPEIRAKAQIPLDSALAERAQASTDPKIQALVANGRILAGSRQDTPLNADGTKNTDNPYMGTGGTAPSRRLAGSDTRPNQELNIPSDRATGNLGANIPPGSEIKLRGPSGTDVVVARLELVAGKPAWVVNPALPPEIAVKIQRNVVPAVTAGATAAWGGAAAAGPTAAAPASPPPAHAAVSPASAAVSPASAAGSPASAAGSPASAAVAATPSAASSTHADVSPAHAHAPAPASAIASGASARASGAAAPAPAHTAARVSPTQADASPTSADVSPTHASAPTATSADVSPAHAHAPTATSGDVSPIHSAADAASPASAAPGHAAMLVPDGAAADARAVGHAVAADTEVAAERLAASAPRAPISVDEVLGESFHAHRAELAGLAEPDVNDPAGVAGVQALDHVTRLTDPALARRAFGLVAAGDARMNEAVAAALSRAETRRATDPDGADAALAQDLGRIGRFLEIGSGMPIGRPDPARVEDATAALLRGETLDGARTTALLDETVAAARKQILADHQLAGVQVGTDSVARGEHLGGYCGVAQFHVAKRLGQLGESAPAAPSVILHHVPEERKAGVFQGDFAHFFTVVRMPDGRPYLVDPTFGQFLLPPGRDTSVAAGRVGRDLLDTPSGEHVATALVTRGYVELTDEVARDYGAAITNGRRTDLGVDDFVQASLTDPKRRRTEDVPDDIHAAYAQLPVVAHDGSGAAAVADGPGHARSDGPTAGSQGPGGSGSVEASSGGSGHDGPTGGGRGPGGPDGPGSDGPDHSDRGPGRPGGPTDDPSRPPPGVPADVWESHAAEVARRYVRATDIDAPTATASDRIDATRSAQVMAHIARTTDPDLARAAFELARSGHPLVDDRLVSLFRYAEAVGATDLAQGREKLRAGLDSLTAEAPALLAVAPRAPTASPSEPGVPSRATATDPLDAVRAALPPQQAALFDARDPGAAALAFRHPEARALVSASLGQGGEADHDLHVARALIDRFGGDLAVARAAFGDSPAVRAALDHHQDTLVAAAATRVPGLEIDRTDPSRPLLRLGDADPAQARAVLAELAGVSADDGPGLTQALGMPIHDPADMRAAARAAEALPKPGDPDFDGLSDVEKVQALTRAVGEKARAAWTVDKGDTAESKAAARALTQERLAEAAALDADLRAILRRHPPGSRVHAVSPEGALGQAGVRWADVKGVYEGDEGAHATMWAVVHLRKRIVDELVAEIRDEGGPLPKGFTEMTLGSVNLGSDYDISLEGSADAAGVAEFNRRFREKWRKEAGEAFDTNLYTAGEYMPAVGAPDAGRATPMKPSDDATPRDRVLLERHPLFTAEGRLADDAHQDALSLAKTRKHMPPEEWKEFKRAVLAGLEDDPVAQRRALDALNAADAHHRAYTAELADKVRELSDGKTPTHDVELEASNRLYEERLVAVKDAVDERDGFLARNPTPRSPAVEAQADLLTAEVKKRQGEALLFANEAYNSEGALRHVVGNLQGRMGMELTRQQALSSFNEQLGDTLKDLHHYAGSFGGAAFKSSKYVERLLDAAVELGIPLADLPNATKLQTAAKELLLIRGNKAPYDTLSGAEKRAAAEKIAAANGIEGPEALKAWVLTIGEAVNTRARRGSAPPPGAGDGPAAPKGPDTGTPPAQTPADSTHATPATDSAHATPATDSAHAPAATESAPAQAPAKSATPDQAPTTETTADETTAGVTPPVAEALRARAADVHALAAAVPNQGMGVEPRDAHRMVDDLDYDDKPTKRKEDLTETLPKGTFAGSNEQTGLDVEKLPVHRLPSARTTLPDGTPVLLVGVGDFAGMQVAPGDNAVVASRNYSSCASMSCSGTNADGQLLAQAHFAEDAPERTQHEQALAFLQHLPRDRTWEIFLHVDGTNRTEEGAIDADKLAAECPWVKLRVNRTTRPGGEERRNVYTTPEGVIIERFEGDSQAPGSVGTLEFHPFGSDEGTVVPLTKAEAFKQRHGGDAAFLTERFPGAVADDEQLAAWDRDLARWNPGKSGRNQGVDHVIAYAEGAGGEGKVNRLRKLTELAGEGPFDHRDPGVIGKVNAALDRIVANATLTHIDGDKVVTWTPAVGAPNPPKKGSDGILVIRHAGKYATFMNSELRGYERMTRAKEKPAPTPSKDTEPKDTEP